MASASKTNNKNLRPLSLSLSIFRYGEERPKGARSPPARSLSLLPLPGSCAGPRDAWAFYASTSEHETAVIETEAPRVALGFGWVVQPGTYPRT